MTETIGWLRSQDLSRVPTRQLLAQYERLRNRHRYIEDGGWAAEPSYERVEMMMLMKQELSKREHVPNVLEARVVRQQKAKAKRNRGRQD